MVDRGGRHEADDRVDRLVENRETAAASPSVRVSGGAIRSTLPCRPPLPISRPRFFVSSMIFAAAATLGVLRAGRDELDTDHQSLAAHLADEVDASAMPRRPSIKVVPTLAAFACRSWEST